MAFESLLTHTVSVVRESPRVIANVSGNSTNIINGALSEAGVIKTVVDAVTAGQTTSITVLGKLNLAVDSEVFSIVGDLGFRVFQTTKEFDYITSITITTTPSSPPRVLTFTAINNSGSEVPVVLNVLPSLRCRIGLPRRGTMDIRDAGLTIVDANVLFTNAGEGLITVNDKITDLNSLTEYLVKDVDILYDGNGYHHSQVLLEKIR